MESSRIARILIVGPKSEHKEESETLLGLIASEKVHWIEPQNSPCTSAMAGLDEMGVGDGILITTADHAFLSPEIIESFCQSLELVEADTVAGLVPYSTVKEKFPESKRTALRFKDNSFCGCNLFAIKNPEGTKAVSFWRQVETQRKRPWRIASIIGWKTLFAFVFGRLTAEAAMKDLSAKVGAKLNYALVNLADAAVDIDTVADLNFVESYLKESSAKD